MFIDQLKSYLNNKNLISVIILFFLWIIFTVIELVGITSIPIFLSLFLENSISIKVPFLNNYLTSITSIEKKNLFMYFILLIVLLFFIKSLFFSFLVYFEQITFKSITTDVKKRTFTYYFNLPFKDHLKLNSSDLLRIITLDTSNAISYVQNVISLSTQILLTSSISIYLLYIDFSLTLIVILFFSIILLTIYFYSGNKLSLFGKLKQKFAGEGIKIINEGVINIKEVIIYKKINFLISLYTEKQKVQQDQVLKINLIKRLPRGLYEFLAISFIMFILAFKILYNGESVESSIVFISLLVFALARLLPAVNLINLNISAIKSCEYSFVLIYENLIRLKFLQENKKIKSDNFKFKSEINFDNVSFSYKKNSQLLKNLSFKIKKNNIVGIFGESGCGKSTILNLLTGLLSPTNGNILIDEKNLENEIDSWQSKIGYIPQDNFLLDDTIKKNIIFSDELEEFDEDKFKTVTSIASLKSFISLQEEGIETKIGDRGINISGGQRQRIGIARALYANPEILIFDEATSALDHDTEKEILDNIYSIKDKTIVIISHKLKNLARCHKIFQVKNKNILELDKALIEDIK
jgi:ABC-type multidrug transport system fused ATPase/permease subunit